MLRLSLKIAPLIRVCAPEVIGCPSIRYNSDIQCADLNVALASAACFCMRRSIGHDGCGSYNAGTVAFNDGAIHACGQAEVIGVYDQSSHRLSLTKAVGGKVIV